MTLILLLHRGRCPTTALALWASGWGVWAPSLQMSTDMRRRPVVMVGEASHAVEGGATGG